MKPQLTSLISFVLVLELLFAGTVAAQNKAVAATVTRKPTVPAKVSTKSKTDSVPNLGNFRITVPMEMDWLGSGFKIATGSVLTGVTAMGIFTARDQALGTVVSYAGLEANLKFTAHVSQEWIPPTNVVWADVMPMRLNRAAGIREFRTNEDKIYQSLNTSSGKVIIEGLASGEYIIRGRTRTNEYVFLPVSVIDDKRSIAQSN